MNSVNKDEVTEEFNVGKVRAHLKREIQVMGVNWPKQVSYTFLLLPGLEENWLNHLKESGQDKWRYFDGGKMIEMLTMPHSSMHKIASELEVQNSLIPSMGQGVINTAIEVMEKWKRQERPKPEPIALGKTLVLPESVGGRWCLRTEHRNGEDWYLVSRQKGKQRIPGIKLKPKYHLV